MGNNLCRPDRVRKPKENATQTGTPIKRLQNKESCKPRRLLIDQFSLNQLVIAICNEINVIFISV